MRLRTVVTAALLLVPVHLAGQGLRQVPQRFAYIQPMGLAFGVANAGIEFSIARQTTVEIGGVGVYSVEDGIKIYGGGPGLGIRQYFGGGEVDGLVIGLRTDVAWLTADNSGADAGFLSIGSLRSRESDFFVGFGAMLGYRWLSRSGFFLEPMFGYEFFVGQRPLVAGSQRLQDHLGPTLGVAIGFAL